MSDDQSKTTSEELDNENVPDVDLTRLDLFYQFLNDYLEKMTPSFSIDNLQAQLKEYFEFQLKFNASDSGENDLSNISYYELSLLELAHKQKELDLLDLCEKLKNIVSENVIIGKKKLELLDHGLKLKKYRRYPNSLLTLLGRVTYERSALVPSSKSQSVILKSLGYDGFVFPVDEALGISRLPFKITVPAMLEIAKTAVACDSFEDAEQILFKKSNMKVNDDTIRKVTNVVGSIVLENDKKVASEIWEKTPPWKFVAPDHKLAHTLYLEVGGAMLQTRDTVSEHGSLWMENKLGMAFSTDHFLRWIDKHGVPQHRILKKEFISLIGTNENFKLHLYSLAIRNGYGIYKNTVLLSDGATWIRLMKEELFDNCQQILDYYHLCEKISIFAKEIFSLDEKKYKPWAEKVSKLFKKSKINEAISGIKSVKPSLLKKASFDLLEYINNNRDSMDYATYMRKGFFIGSGAIESASRTVLQRRLKLPGTRWNIQSAQNIVALASKYRSCLWESEVVRTICNHFNFDEDLSCVRPILGKF
ncbi:MAG: hypothetical protein LBO05_01855 [Deltaproteobacteria bacterium]|nr:hypothetical protein [Deltaproteobacteria bacterium]